MNDQLNADQSGVRSQGSAAKPMDRTSWLVLIVLGISPMALGAAEFLTQVAGLRYGGSVTGLQAQIAGCVIFLLGFCCSLTGVVKYRRAQPATLSGYGLATLLFVVVASLFFIYLFLVLTR